jgi:outer membrane protein assembly factor BamD (BamD/ComL family)
MTALHQAGRWEAVVAAAQELARLDPGNPDPGGIVSDAKAKLRDAELADRYAQAINNLDQEEWQQAADLFTAIEQEQPGYREAAALITTAQRQRDLAGWSDQAAAAAGQDDWDAVVPVLEKICAVDPTYQDAGVRLEQARSAKRLRTLVDEVTALHQAGRWKEVVAAAEELAQLDPEHPDPGGIVSEARAKREAAERIADLQDKLREYATANNWQAVIEVNDELAALDPEAADPDGLATQARSALRAQAEATEIEERYKEARADEEAGDWTTAISHYSSLSGYRDAETRLHTCQQRQQEAEIAQRRQALIDEMTGLHQAGRWDAVLVAAQQLARLDPDGIVSDAEAKIRDAELADRYTQALNRLDQQEWRQAADLFAAIEQEHPGYGDAAALLTTAQRQRDLAAWSDQAAAAAGHDDWDTALTALENICAVDPTYRDAGGRLAEAQSAIRRRAIVDEVTAAHQAGRWNEVVAAADELAQLDPDYPDPGGVVSDARTKLREAELAERYTDIAMTAAFAARRGAESPDVSQTHMATAVSFFQQMTRRTKIVITSVAVAAVAVVGVVIIVGSQSEGRTISSSGGGAISASVSGIASPSSSMDAAQRLLAMVPSDLHCAPSEPRIGSMASAYCDSDFGQASVRYLLFPDKAAMDEDFNSWSRVLNACPGQGESPQVAKIHRLKYAPCSVARPSVSAEVQIPAGASCR